MEFYRSVATELPVYFEEDDAIHMREELGFDIPKEIDGLVTGHIDFLSSCATGACTFLITSPRRPNSIRLTAEEAGALYAKGK